MYKKIKKKIILHHFFKPLLCLYALTIICENILCCDLLTDPDTNSTAVQCHYSVNLTSGLIKMKENLSETQHYFDYIEIYSPIDEIPSDVFQDISFKHIMIYNSKNLTRISKDAFIGVTKEYTQYFTCFRNFESQLQNEPPEYDLYEAIKSLKYLRTIYLSLGNNISHEIPDNAFKPSDNYPLHHLWFVEFYGYFTISRIGNEAFYNLPHIKSIVFKYANIERISSNAFKMFRNDPNYTLNITFHNTSLTEDCFDEGVFSSTTRKISLDLTNNSIKMIEEKIFSPFFSANDNNRLILSQNPLNCSNFKSFKWLFNNRVNLEKRIFKAVCDNGTKLWDLSNNSDESETTVTEMTNTDSETTVLTTKVMTEVTDSETTTVSEIIDFDTTIDLETEPDFGSSSTISSTLGHSSISSVTKPDIISSSTVSSTTESHLSSSSKVTNSHSSTSLVTKPWITSTSTVSSTESHCSDNEYPNHCHTISDIIQRIENLINITKNDKSLNSSEELNNILSQIQEIQNSLDPINNLDFETALNLTTNILNILSNLLNQNNAWINTSLKERTSIGSQILLQTQFTSTFLTCNQNNSNQRTDRITNDNIIVHIYHNYDNQINFQVNDSSILIPEEVVHLNGTNGCGNSSFAALVTRLGEYLNESLSIDQNINTQIISYSLTNSSDTIQFDHGALITYRLKHKTRLEFGDKMICAFWDFSVMNWSTNGCQLLISESDRDATVCQCNHLTNFAAIMDVSNRETDDFLKSILTNIFCGISLFCLILTIWLLLKPQRNNTNTITNRLVRTRTLITLNLSIMLSIANIFIIFGMDRTKNEILCKAISAILLYSLLSSFSWMSLEGYHLYKMTVQVFDSNTRKLFLFLFGYGIPVVIIFVGLLIVWIQDSILFDALTGEYFCWISSARYPGHIWLLIGPAMIAIIFNILMMIELIRRVLITNMNQNSNKFKLRIKQIFGVTSLLFNLGITWLSFILYIKQFGSYFSYFSYVFIVLNGSQGIFIFIYHLVIYLSKDKKLRNLSLKTSLRLTLSLKWSTKTTQTQLGDN